MTGVWYRAVWVEGDTEVECTVPSIWVNESHVNKFVWWPPGPNAEKYLKEYKEPTEKWRKFPLLRIKMKGGYDECEDCHMTTADEDSDGEKRQPLPNVKKYEGFVLDQAASSSDANNPEGKSQQEKQNQSQKKLPAPPQKYEIKNKEGTKNEIHSTKAQSKTRVENQTRERRESQTREIRESQNREIRESQNREIRESQNKERDENKTKDRRESQTTGRRESQNRERSENKTTERRESQSRQRRESQTREIRESQNRERSENKTTERRESQSRQRRESQTREIRESQKRERGENKTRERRENQITERRESQTTERGRNKTRERRESQFRENQFRESRMGNHNQSRRGSGQPGGNPAMSRINSVRQWSRSKSWSPYEEFSRSRTRSPSPIRSRSPTRSRSFRRSISRSRSFRRSISRSRSFRRSISRSRSFTRSVSRSMERSRTRSRSCTPAEAQRPTKIQYPISEAKFQKSVMELLVQIRNDFRNEFSRIRRREELAEPFQFTTCETVQDLDDLEEELKDTKFKKYLVRKLSTIGGVNCKDGVRNICRRLMTNDLMSKLNIKGHRGKISFGKFKLCKLITETAADIYKTTEMEAQNVIASVLKYAPDRMGGGGRQK